MTNNDAVKIALAPMMGKQPTDKDLQNFYQMLGNFNLIIKPMNNMDKIALMSGFEL